jgi:beta-fructofuranosidase
MDQPAVTRFDKGANFYAASAMRTSPAGPLVWGWVTEGRSADWTVEADWSGMLSLPRSVSLTPAGQLACRPVDGLDTLRGEQLEPSEGSTTSTMAYDGLPAQVELEFALAGAARGGGDAAPTRVSLRCGGDEHLDVVVDRPFLSDRAAAVAAGGHRTRHR